MKSPHCCLKDMHHIGTGKPWRCYWTHPVSTTSVSWAWTILWKWPLPLVWMTPFQLWGSNKRPQTTFVKDITTDSFVNVPSGTGIIFSVVPAASRPGCLPFILGNVPFLLPLTSSSLSAGLKDDFHFSDLAPTNLRRYSTVPDYAADEFLLIS